MQNETRQKGAKSMTILDPETAMKLLTLLSQFSSEGNKMEKVAGNHLSSEEADRIFGQRVMNLKEKPPVEKEFAPEVMETDLAQSEDEKPQDMEGEDLVPIEFKDIINKEITVKITVKDSLTGEVAPTDTLTIKTFEHNFDAESVSGVGEGEVKTGAQKTSFLTLETIMQTLPEVMLMLEKASRA